MSKRLTKDDLQQLRDKSRLGGVGERIRCKVAASADDAFCQERLGQLADKLAHYVRLELSNTLYGEYNGTGFEVMERRGITTALKILGCKVEYYEE